MGIISPGKIRSWFEPIVTVCCWDEAHRECCCGRRAGLWWFEASRKYARPMNRNDEGAEAEAAVASHFFSSSWTGSSRKTGRSRNEGNYQATSVDVLRTLRGGKAGGEYGHNQSGCGFMNFHAFIRLWALRRRRNADKMQGGLPS